MDEAEKYVLDVGPWSVGKKGRDVRVTRYADGWDITLGLGYVEQRNSKAVVRLSIGDALILAGILEEVAGRAVKAREEYDLRIAREEHTLRWE